MNEFERLLNTPYSELDSNQVMNSDKEPDSEKEIKKVILDRRIDPESKIIIDTFNATLDKVFTPVMSRPLECSLDYAKTTSNYDFSQLINSLSKVFEREMNNSIVQWIRLKHGIEMPFYYKKWKPGVRVAVEIGVNYRININKEREKGELAAISIGDILCLIENRRDLIRKDLIPDEIGTLFDQRRDLFTKLRKCRNSSSHTEVTNEPQFRKFYKRYTSLVSEGWFTELMNLKDKVR